MPKAKSTKPKRTAKPKSTALAKRYRPAAQELKWFDSSLNAGLVGGLAGNVYSLNLVSQGTGPSQRIGRTITVRHIEIKINLEASWVVPVGITADTRNISYRVDLILDKQANGAYPVGADIYDTALGAGVVVTNKFANLLNSDRFVFMKRWEGDMNPPSSTTVVAGANNIFTTGRDLKYKKRCSIPIELTPQAATTIADCRSNNLLLVYSYTTASGQQTAVVSSADTRILYSD